MSWKRELGACLQRLVQLRILPQLVVLHASDSTCNICCVKTEVLENMMRDSQQFWDPELVV